MLALQHATADRGEAPFLPERIVMFAVKPRPKIPTHGSLSLFLRIRNPLPYIAERVRTDGPIVGWNGFGTMIVLFDDPVAIEETLVSKATSFEKTRGTLRLRELLGRGLLTEEQPEHLRNRRLVQPAFHRARLEGYGAVMAETSARNASAWRDGEVLDVGDEMSRLALEIAARSLFDADVGGDVERISNAIDRTMAAYPFLVTPGSEALERLPLPVMQKFRAARRDLDDVVLRMVRERRAADVDRGDVLSMLLTARDDGDAGGFDDVQVRDEVLTILLAGHETTANALTWAFYLLQRHPDVEARLHDHLDDVLDGRTPGFADVPRLGFARNVIAETMRLYPPAWMMARGATRDVEVGGYPMRKGDVAFVSQWITHRNPAYWSEPERFDPSRFERGEPSAKFAYFPFGGGTRLCIGESFAWTEATLALAAIAQRVRLAAVGDGDVDTMPRVTLRPASPIRARVRARVRREVRVP